MRRCIAALLAALALGGPGATVAMAGCPQTNLPDIEDEVMCLQCGVPLNLAEDAPSAQREIAFIRPLIAHCDSKAQIKRALVAQFGDRVLAQPKGSAAWLVPTLGFAGGVAIVGVAWLRWRRARRDRGEREAAVAAGSPPVAAGDDARLEADLERYEL